MTTLLYVELGGESEPAYEPDPSGWTNCPSCGALFRCGGAHDCTAFLAYRARLRRRPGAGLLDDPAEIERELHARRRHR